MAYDVVIIVWTEDFFRYELPYEESRTVEATVDDEASAHEIAEGLVEAWASAESLAKRFVNGRDHGAYVENWQTGKAHGIRASVLPNR